MRITPDHLENGSTQKRTRAEPREAFLRRITHVSLVGKDISVMENLHFCKNLTVLYLYDNNITTISGLECCRNLSRLYLQNNAIEEISGLDVGLDQLSVLHLHNNRIKFVNGLERLPALEQLKLDRQQLPEGTALEFDPDCLATIAPALRQLTVAGNHISDITCIAVLRQLEHLDVSENEIADLKPLEEFLSTCPHLSSLDISLTPLAASITPAKLRQKLILASTSLDSLNEKPIPPVERKFVENLRKVQERRKSFSTNPLSKQSSLTALDTALQAPNALQEKPIPHLPPYASQYRDLILSMQSNAPRTAAESRSRNGSLANVATAAEGVKPEEQ
ncbi:hypothetical protein DFJ77DRAFT_1180 [Powellomyces hirtus]|nr:hypothetical protein DFJ77DRAFT_1180 [Powellomyces hirtus]